MTHLGFASCICRRVTTRVIGALTVRETTAAVKPASQSLRTATIAIFKRSPSGLSRKTCCCAWSGVETPVILESRPHNWRREPRSGRYVFRKTHRVGSVARTVRSPPEWQAASRRTRGAKGHWWSRMTKWFRMMSSHTSHNTPSPLTSLRRVPWP